MRRGLRGLLVIPFALAGLAGCSNSDGGSTATGETSAPPTAGRAPVDVVASFYPLQWVTEQVGGEQVSVSSLTPPGAEPHDLELTPADVAAVSDADLVVYLSGFQPAVDDAVEGAQGAAFDAADSAQLTLTYTPIEADEGTDEGADEADATDPHFWLDPRRLADVADALARSLGDLDPADAETFEANAVALRDQLLALDEDYRTALATCASRDLVTSHNAFGYLAERYDLTQVGITGLTPEEEPSPADLAEVTQFVEDHDVHTIYFETLVSPAIAETVASETGASTAVLDPIEGLSEESEGDDYLEIMRSNLANLVAGQSCS
jgi:zinc transport system substrate-binding protein